ncbi:MAG: protease modulator HflC [Gemmatimonadota bacterium]|nr:protease modulator HflC [Gemmatimonadota bacterium]
MKKAYLSILLIPVALVLFYLLCTTVVIQGEITVLMSFGKPVKVITMPGIYLKLPYPFHRVEKLDGRLSMLQPRPSEFLTADKKNLILENAICYKIADPILFMKTVRDIKGLEIRLIDLLSSHTGLLLGVIDLSDMVNVDAGKIKYYSMNEELTALMKKDGDDLGIEVEQVFIKRIMLPYENTIAVYDRMRAERNRIAKKYIAEGEETALRIRAEADKNSRTIIAEAKNKATVIMGQAEAEAMRIYGESYQKNMAFYRYIRSLEAYENMFNEKTVIILDEKSPIMKSFFSGAR